MHQALHTYYSLPYRGHFGTSVRGIAFLKGKSMPKSVTVIAGPVANPDFSYTNTGLPVLKFSLPDEVYKGKDAKGNYLRETQWIRIVMFGDVAEKLYSNETLFKGTIVRVQGQMVLKTYSAKDGSSRSYLEMTVNEVDLISNFGKKNKEKSGQEMFGSVQEEVVEPFDQEKGGF